MFFKQSASALVCLVVGLHPPAGAAPPTARLEALAAALRHDAWERSHEVYQMPPIDAWILPDAARGATELRGCTEVVLAGQPWPQCTWSWTRFSGAPAGRDWLELRVTLTPAGTAADYMLRSLAESALSTEELVARYRAAVHPPGLGTMALLVERPDLRDVVVTFMRGNAVVRVHGHGGFLSSTMPAALALDDRLLRRPTDLLGR